MLQYMTTLFKVLVEANAFIDLVVRLCTHYHQLPMGSDKAVCVVVSHGSTMDKL